MLGRKEVASAREAILDAINNHARTSPIRALPSLVDASLKQDIELVGVELQGLSFTSGKTVDGIFCSMATKDDIRDLKLMLISQ